MQGRTAYPDDFNQSSQETPKVEKKSRGLSRFNPFSSDNKEDTDKNISDEEFDSTINQAMQDMEDNIRFKPSNDNQFRDNPQYNSNQHNQNYYNQNQYNLNQHNQNHYNPNHNAQNQNYGQSYPNQSRGYDRNYDNRNYNNQNYDDRYYDDYSKQYGDSRPLRDTARNNHYNDYRQNENYRQNDTYGTRRVNPNYNSNSQNQSHSRAYPNDDGEIDYKYRSPRDSRKSRRRNPSSDEYYREEPSSNYEKDDGNTQDEVFKKHARKFRR